MDKPSLKAWLFGRFASRRQAAKLPITTPHAIHSNPNREFARTGSDAIWFFVFLPIFMLLHAIVEKMNVQ